MLETPIVTIIIVFWNGEGYLLECLRRLSAQTFLKFEILIVNNGSLLEWSDNLKADNLLLHHLGANLGFAAANNIGSHIVHGKWIALLNADAFPEPTWLETLLQAVEKHPDYSAFSSRQIQFQAPHLLDGIGDVYHVSGLAWRNGHNLPVEENGLSESEIFSPCAAAAMYSREEFLKAGGFDEDYFSYFEDVDLGFRLRLNGAKCMYVPEAVVYHVGSASTGKRSDFSVYYGYRNMIWTFFKDMPSPYFWLFLPLHISAVLFFMVYLTLRGQGKTILKAVFDAVCGLPKMLRKRKVIQKNKIVKNRDLIKIMSTGLFEPYKEFIQRNRSK